MATASTLFASEFVRLDTNKSARNTPCAVPRTRKILISAIVFLISSAGHPVLLAHLLESDSLCPTFFQNVDPRFVSVVYGHIYEKLDENICVRCQIFPKIGRYHFLNDFRLFKTTRSAVKRLFRIECQSFAQIISIVV